MFNNFSLIGTIDSINLNNESGYTITLKIQKDFKNEKGEFEYEYIPFIVRGALEELVLNDLGDGDKIGVKGRIITNFWDSETAVELLAEKIQYLKGAE